MIPEELQYTREHEWIRRTGDRVTLGITHYAQDKLGDVVYVDLPEPGQRVQAGDTVAEVESTKATAPVYTPVSGEVVEVNAALGEHPEWVNEEPYGKGWMVVIRTSGADPEKELLDASAYRALVAQEAL